MPGAPAAAGSHTHQQGLQFERTCEHMGLATVLTNLVGPLLCGTELALREVTQPASGRRRLQCTGPPPDSASVTYGLPLKWPVNLHFVLICNAKVPQVEVVTQLEEELLRCSCSGPEGLVSDEGGTARASRL